MYEHILSSVNTPNNFNPGSRPQSFRNASLLRGNSQQSSTRRESFGEQFKYPPLPTAEIIELRKYAGAPEEFVAKLCGRWRVGIPDAVKMLGGTPNAKRALIGIGKLQERDAQDRVVELFKIHRALSGLYDNNVDAEISLLNRVQPQLDGSKPIDLILGGSYPQLLLAREFIEYVARG